MQFPSLEELKARGTRKWTVYGDDVLPLWIAESDFPTAPPVMEAIERAVKNESFGYTPGTSTLPEELAGFYNRRFGWEPNPDYIFTIGDVVRGMLLGVQYFTTPGSPVVVPVPSYPPLLELPETAGREKIETSLDLDEIEAAFAKGAGSIVLSTPFNPLGIAFEKDWLTRLVNIADKYGARILADEIHAGIVYEGTHIPLASLSDRVITVTATSKAFNVAGLKCAQMIFANADDVKTWRSLTGVAKDGTGTLGVLAAEAAYRDGDPYLDEQLAILKQNRDFAADAFAKAGIESTRPAATYLMWLTLPQLGEKPAAWLRAHAKVAVNEGVTFAAPGHARLNFATSPEILREAVERITTAL